MDISAIKTFRKVYKGDRNIMTQEILDVRWIVPNRFVVEISKGRGFENETIYGLTVVEVNGELIERRPDLSGCFWSWNGVNEQIDFIKTL